MLLFSPWCLLIFCKETTFVGLASGQGGVWLGGLGLRRFRGLD